MKVGYCEIEGTEFLARYRRYSLLPIATVDEFSLTEPKALHHELFTDVTSRHRHRQKTPYSDRQMVMDTDELTLINTN